MLYKHRFKMQPLLNSPFCSSTYCLGNTWMRCIDTSPASRYLGWVWPEVGKQTFKSAKSQILKFLGSFRNLPIRRFLRCASPKIANLIFFRINPQIEKPKISSKYCTTLSQNIHESHLFKRSYYAHLHIFELEHFLLYLQVEKVCICGLAEVRKSQKRLGP
jgi:hypothetical protein